jgi:hypothetical protein
MPSPDLAQEIQRRAAETTIREKLVELIRLASAHGIDIEGLMYQALDEADIEHG